MYLTFFKDKAEVPVLTTNDFSLDDIFAGRQMQIQQPVTPRTSFETKTVITDRIPGSYDAEKIRQAVQEIVHIAVKFNPATLNEHYNKFFIPKKTGGLREINAPDEELMNALRDIKNIFQYDFKVLYHNAAYAYTPQRNIVAALQKHQENKSRWFLKLDIKDFFPSCSQDFVVKTLHRIYPFNMISEAALNTFMWICFLNNELPQGTPMSPMLTNLIMIPVDYAIQNYAYENNLVYTRYADDILISARNSFDWRQTVQAINTIFNILQTPFQIKAEKTRYGSAAGRNWNLGLMYNKDCNITVGYRNKKMYKAMLNNLMTAEASNEPWDKDELYHFQGVTSYYLSVEPEYFKNLIKKYEDMYNITLKEIYKLRL